MKFSSKKLKILIVIVIIISIVLLLNLFSKNVRGFFYSISSPIQKPLWKIGDSVSDFFGAVIWIKNLKKENQEIKFKNQELIVEIAALEDLKKENETLRTALGFGLEKDFKLTLVQIISKDISQDYILVDKGEKDGILKGMSVITEQKVLLGKVYEVYKNNSKVMLISNKESSFDAKIKEKDIFGIVKGKGDLKIFLDLIPRDKEISQEDIVISTRLGGVFPDGLLVGQITKIIKNDIESLQQAEIKLAFNIKEINYLFIITDY